MSEFGEHAHSATNHPPKKKGKGCLIAALVVGLLGMLMFGGCLGVVWFSMGKMDEQVLAQLQSSPRVTAYVGTVEKAKLNLKASGEASNGAAPGLPNKIMIYDVTGSKRSARVTGKMDRQTGAFQVEDLTTPSGGLAILDHAPANPEDPSWHMFTILIVPDSNPASYQLNKTKPIDAKSLEMVLSRVTPEETIHIEVPEGMDKVAEEEVAPLLRKYGLEQTFYGRPAN